jgi:hypothetical protein
MRLRVELLKELLKYNSVEKTVLHARSREVFKVVDHVKRIAGHAQLIFPA